MDKIFITGTSSGLGFALSQILSTKTRHVIGFSRTKSDFTGEFHTCDFTKPQLAESILKDAFNAADLDNAKRITFVHNAGQLGPLDLIQNFDHTDIQQNITANLIGSAIALSTFTKAVAHLAVPKLFINISSGAAFDDRAKAGWSLYCASKAGQAQLVRAVAIEQETAPHPITLINFNPGVMETGMQRLIRATPENAFPDVQRFIQLKEEGRVPEPTTIAQHLVRAILHPENLENAKSYHYADFEPLT